VPVATVLPPLGDSPSALPPAVATRLLALGGPPSVPPPLQPIAGLEGAGNRSGRAAGHRGGAWRTANDCGGEGGRRLGGEGIRRREV